METVMKDLKQALCDTMTKQILKEAVYKTSAMVFFDDFLGNGDRDKDGNPVVCTFKFFVAGIATCPNDK